MDCLQLNSSGKIIHRRARRNPTVFGRCVEGVRVAPLNSSLLVRSANAEVKCQDLGLFLTTEGAVTEQATLHFWH